MKQKMEKNKNRQISEQFMKILRDDKNILDFYRLAHKYKFVDRKVLQEHGIYV